MSRAGITKQAVQQARDALVARGDNPSIDAVRIELGNTGSKSTIHRLLKELEQPPACVDDKAGLSAPLSHLVEQLAAQLQREAQARIEAAQARFDDQCKQWQAQLEHAEGALVAVQQRLADKQEQLDGLEAQRNQDQRRHETQVRQLQGQLHTLQQAAIAQQQESTRLHRDNERLLAEQRQARERGESLVAQLEQRDAQVQGLRAMLAQMQGAGEELRRQLAEARVGQA